jgi:hypothetical protein
MSRDLSGIAPESGAVQRAREKLLKRWEKEQGKNSPEILKAVNKKIQAQYHRSVPTRVRVPDKPIGLFSNGEGVIAASPKIAAVKERVMKDYQMQQDSHPDMSRIIVKPLAREE